ncbi:tRNA lysidine(34) synthetase TilS [Opitutus terrae]|uniref:tRNA(Ile)-lysidine synthase n=1 Tax=Opitutus terrae (strain DSM 11246 / JCM 15787 / PB90-1) TaxID=452637 RepID=B1ZVZ7_OPITP|nr:tRNA lysidine(34) synthetase TilS [Opitutus terrae]ACB76013.1 tRNA(Ile)-lysidine synthetase [Opitutus terrae PB90-1]
MAARKPIDWPQCAARLAAIVPRERLHPAVLAHAAQPGKREPWMVAFSGGADSLALLLLLWAHWPEHRRRLSAAHFNHRLRGRAALQDERFCARVCAALHVPLAVDHWEDRPAKPSEAEARTARHAFFDRQLRKRRARVLWFGHQQDDIAETLLMRLARGSGLAGLAAPRPVQAMPAGKVHLRPLLGLKKAELAAALRRCGASWCEDQTNAGEHYLRSRIRQRVLPAWRAAVGERDALAGAALSRELMEEDDTALQAWLARLAPLREDGSLNLRRLRGVPVAVVRRALHQWLLQHERSTGLSRQCFASLLAAVLTRRTTRLSIGTGVFAEVGRDRLRIVSGVRNKRGQFQRRIN